MSPFDADDSHCINLALATRSQLVVSRDKHLLNLMDQTHEEARDFVKRFPGLWIIEPQILLQMLRTKS
ncbi:MAG: hypothetical protein FWD61_17005 [Phycisphaerales bacterium]|nr:hypothetical protein [Phycisphaerales bacterium]